MGRWIRFLLAILTGAALGLSYGWYVSPVEYVDTSPETLKIDFKTDYVLMAAEAYQQEGNLGAAVQQLSVLGGSSPEDTVHRALLFAEPRYTDADLARLRALYQALQTSSTTATQMEPQVPIVQTVTATLAAGTPQETRPLAETAVTRSTPDAGLLQETPTP
jgi:hypothetical protein